MINCRFKLDDIFTVFSTLYMDQLGKTSRHHWNWERIKMRKIAKFESDFLKTYEDIAPQNCENLQTFVWWWWGLGGGQVCDPLHTNVCKISRPWLRKFTDVCMVGESKFVPTSPLQTSVKFLDLDCENLQKFVGGGEHVCAPPPPPPPANVCKISWLWGYISISFQQITFKFGNFINFKGLFSVVSTDFSERVHVKIWLEKIVLTREPYEQSEGELTEDN